MFEYFIPFWKFWVLLLRPEIFWPDAICVFSSAFSYDYKKVWKFAGVSFWINWLDKIWVAREKFSCWWAVSMCVRITMCTSQVLFIVWPTKVKCYAYCMRMWWCVGMEWSIRLDSVIINHAVLRTHIHRQSIITQLCVPLSIQLKKRGRLKKIQCAKYRSTVYWF